MPTFSRYGAKLITVDADETPHLFGADFFHINTAGHRHVANSIWRDYKQLPCAAFSPAAVEHGGHETGMECAIAEDLDLLVGRRSSGFERINLGQDRGVSKIGYDATAPGASLDLCVDLPRQAAQDAVSELEKVTVQKSGLNRYDPSHTKEKLLHGDTFAFSVGIQTSHPKNRPLHGRVRRTAPLFTAFFSRRPCAARCVHGRLSSAVMACVLAPACGVARSKTMAPTAAASTPSRIRLPSPSRPG